MPSTLKLTPATLKAFCRRRVAGHAPAPVPQFFSCYGCRAELLFHFDSDAFSQESRRNYRRASILAALCHDLIIPGTRTSTRRTSGPSSGGDLCVIAGPVDLRHRADTGMTSSRRWHRRRTGVLEISFHTVAPQGSALENHPTALRAVTANT